MPLPHLPLPRATALLPSCIGNTTPQPGMTNTPPTPHPLRCRSAWTTTVGRYHHVQFAYWCTFPHPDIGFTPHTTFPRLLCLHHTTLPHLNWLMVLHLLFSSGCGFDLVHLLVLLHCHAVCCCHRVPHTILQESDVTFTDHLHATHALR